VGRDEQLPDWPLTVDPMPRRNSVVSMSVLLFVLLSLALPGRADAKEKGGKPQKHEERRDHDGDRMRFQGMDRNTDGLISRDEWRGNDKSFSNHDWNHDGVLSSEELRGGGRRSDGEARRDSNNFGRHRFDALDADRDGWISRGEWDRAFNRGDGGAGAFDRFDPNNDGLLSREEFLSRTNGMQVPDALLRDLDNNRDGRLSRDEWRGRQDFERLDRNRDGQLSRNELARR